MEYFHVNKPKYVTVIRWIGVYASIRQGTVSWRALMRIQSHLSARRCVWQNNNHAAKLHANFQRVEFNFLFLLISTALISFSLWHSAYIIHSLALLLISQKSAPCALALLRHAIWRSWQVSFWRVPYNILDVFYVCRRTPLYNIHVRLSGAHLNFQIIQHAPRALTGGPTQIEKKMNLYCFSAPIFQQRNPQPQQTE